MAVKNINERTKLVTDKEIVDSGFDWSTADIAPSKLRLYEPLIVNTDVSHGAGIHWTLWYPLKRGVFVYDPLGENNERPNDDMSSQIPKTYFKGASQTKSSTLCGYFSIYIARLFRLLRPKSAEDASAIIEGEFGKTPDGGDVIRLAKKEPLLRRIV